MAPQSSFPLITSGKCGYEETPSCGFHSRVSLAASGGQVSDGYVMGTIGIALSYAQPTLYLDALWLGLIGGASLAGLFFGSLLFGRLADRLGRRPLFIATMVIFAILSVLQFWVQTAAQLLVLRLLLGLALGVDYVVCAAVVSEFAPRHSRGRLLCLLSFAWVLGYTGAYIVGALLAAHLGGEPWRWILVSSVVPAVVALLLRLPIPETPPWLMQQERFVEAAAIVVRCMGPHVNLPQITAHEATGKASPWIELLSRKYRIRTLVGATFFTTVIIPYFAMGTFIPIVFAAFGIHDAYTSGLIFNLFLLLGSGAGVWMIDRITRRQMIIGGFFISAAALFILTVMGNDFPVLVVALFALFAFVLAVVANLAFVYLPELFPTRLRAAGVGVGTAASRAGSATATFLLPLSMEVIGIRPTLGLCVAVLVVGGIVCQLFAPETQGRSVEEF